MLGHTNRDSAESMGGIFQITTRYGFRLAIWYDMVQPGILGIFRKWSNKSILQTSTAAAV